MLCFSSYSNTFNLFSLKICLLLLTIIIFSANCNKEEAIQSPNNPNGETVQMPRPTDWILGTWQGTIPAGSQFAGKQVRLFIEKVSAPVSGSVVGYNYQGSFTWDYQGSNEWTVNFKNPMSNNDSYVWWIYDKLFDIETFRCEIFSNTNHVVLSTTQIGSKNTKPTVVNLFLTATINGISETDQYMLTMSKQ